MEKTPIEELIEEIENDEKSIKATKFRPQYYINVSIQRVLRKLKNRYIEKESLFLKQLQAQHEEELKQAVIEAYKQGANHYDFNYDEILYLPSQDEIMRKAQQYYNEHFKK